ncbi:hypothetical protein R2F25_30485 [Streptomyces sp. UP1A-1]|nr:hypothetical protein [Streptomyces sp. UP1A-1]
MAALALAVDKRLVHPVDDAADRDANFGDADPGTVTVSLAGTVWVKVADGTWITAHEEPEAWRNLPLPAGYVGGEESPKIRRVGKQVWMRGRVERTDGGLITSSGDIKIAQVPDDCIPKALASGGAGMTLLGDPVVGLGRVEVLPHGWEKPMRRPRVGHLVQPGPARLRMGRCGPHVLDRLKGTPCAVHLRRHPRRRPHRQGRQRRCGLSGDRAIGRDRRADHRPVRGRRHDPDRAAPHQRGDERPARRDTRVPDQRRDRDRVRVQRHVR